VTCLLDSVYKGRIVAKARAAIEARSKATVVNKARSLLKNAEPGHIVNLLERAHAIGQNNPLRAINLGLSLARSGRSRYAVPLLMYGSTYGLFTGLRFVMQTQHLCNCS
jgi:hypothetical protein